MIRVALVALLVAGSSLAAASAAPSAAARVATEEGVWRTAFAPDGPRLDLRDPAASALAWVAALGDRLAPDNSTFEVVKVKRSLAGVHVGLAQRFDGIPVAGGGVSVHALGDGRVIAVHSSAIVRVDGAMPGDGGFADGRAVLLADGLVGRPAIELRVREPFDARDVYVDPATGAVLAERARGAAATARGHVWINPITEADDPDLRDRSIHASAGLGLPSADPLGPDWSGFYREVELQDLAEDAGGPKLEGPYVHVVGGLSRGTDLKFPRDDPRFAEVMAYHWIDTSHRYVRSLGFHDVANFSTEVHLHEPVDVERRLLTVGGAYAVPGEIWSAKLPVVEVDATTSASFRGVRHSAEDADVLLHEYGHVLQMDQMVAGWPTSIVLEAFADYWSATQIGRLVGPPYDTCEGEWVRSYSWTRSLGTLPCFRDVRNNMSYSQELVDAYEGMGGHYVGQIFSGALWDLRERWGPNATDTLVLESNFLLPNAAGIPEAAEALLLADFALTGGARGAEIASVFAARNVTGLRVTQDVFDAIASHASAAPGEYGASALPAAAAAAVLAVAARARRP